MTARTLVRVLPQAAGRGQNHRRRVHLVVPELLPGGYEALRRALCGSDPEYGFGRVPERYGAGDPERECPRCAAKVRSTDTIDNPSPVTQET